MNRTDYPLLTPHELAAAGHALFGAAWRTALAHAFQVTESVIVMVESGRVPAPADWRARLVALAQDTALRALSAANDLMWREGDADAAAAPTPLYPAAPRRI